MSGPKRKENETFEAFKGRRKLENLLEKRKLKGQVFGLPFTRRHITRKRRRRRKRLQQ